MKYPKTRKSAMKLSRPYYKTGGECCRGHVSKRFTKTGRCVECDYTIHQSKRRNAIKERTPVWADLEKIKEIYSLSESMGAEYHVDHEVPLLGKNVSGLHVHYNLVIKERTENLSKGNKFLV